MRQRSEQGAEIICAVPACGEIVLHVLVEQTAFGRAHRPVLSVVAEICNWLKGNFVFALGDVFVCKTTAYKIA